ncbi:MAG: LAGLIDADG family homing endonuclease [bacterium]|nr:LAGLIDADG family homing endonuclease [bacterium]
MGLIATDGCLSSDGRHLDLTSKDKEQIQTFMRCLDIEHLKIGMKNKECSNWAYRVQWGDVVLYNFLLGIGLMPKKSMVLGKIAMPDKYFLDFLRGSFDGDGSFYSYFDPRWKSSFMYYLAFTSASPDHIEWLQTMLKRLLHVKGHISKTIRDERKWHSLYSLRFAKREALIVMNAMYSTSCRAHLSRKRLKIEAALRIVGESLAVPKKGRRK